MITDTWISMGQEHAHNKIAAMAPFQVNEALMARAAADAMFLHCLPAHIGEEVTEGVFESSAVGGVRRGGKPHTCAEIDPAVGFRPVVIGDLNESVPILEDETGFDRLLGFTIPDRNARGRMIRLGPVLDEILGRASLSAAGEVIAG